MEFENYFGSLESATLTPKDRKIQTCIMIGQDEGHGHQEPKNYSNYLNFITIYMVILSLLFMIFFKTDMKRTKADQINSEERSKNQQNRDPEIANVEQQSLVEPTTSR